MSTVQMTSLMIASETSTIRGRLYVTGAGYARHDVDHLPHQVTLHIGAVLMAEPGEVVGDVVLTAGVLGPGGTPVAGDGVRVPVPMPDRAQLPPEVPAVSGVAFDLPFEAVTAGTHRLVVRAQDAGTPVERDLPFAVLLTAPRAEEGGRA